MKTKLLSLIFILIPVAIFSQVTFTANEVVNPYEGGFRPGMNMGYYPPFSDIELANLAAGNPDIDVKGIGARAVRPGLFEYFVEEWGYNSRLSEFEHYTDINLKDNTCIVGFPSEEHRDDTEYCPGERSEMFKNMYLDIWDGGENGTPVNDENYYALYLYNLVSTYKDYVKFWEIWNEPGYDFTGSLGWLPPGSPGNWWENNPDPCDYKLKAPIFHYIRLLRISYDVIKTIDPDAYIVVSGTGYTSFLDAILRNTDNPADGSVSGDFPLKGGAYFDVMGYHSYPHFDGSMRQWDNENSEWDYFRYSDAAMDGIGIVKDTMQNLLALYGYDGVTYPEKLWTITECNLPRKQFGEFIGSDEAQKNFIIKSFVKCLKDDIAQIHYFKIAEEEEWENAYNEFDLMGFYKKLDYHDLYFQRINDAGISLKTSTDLLFGKTYNALKTNDMNIPNGIRGAAFEDDNGNFTYVLWAETHIDQSEEANALYSFPSGFDITTLVKAEWNYSATNELSSLNANAIQLTGTPVFLIEKKFTTDVQTGCVGQSVTFSKNDIPGVAFVQWTFEGGDPSFSSLPEVNVVFSQQGTHKVKLSMFNSGGILLTEQELDFIVEPSPEVEFDYNISGPIVHFENLSPITVDSFVWDFGDGNTSGKYNPVHVYYFSGNYSVQLSAYNKCGDYTISKTFHIDVPAPGTLGFSANDTVAHRDGIFRAGVNLEYFPLWKDEQLADIAAGNADLDIEGVGVKAIRTALGENFLKNWGYDIRFHTFQHYNNLDIRENTLTLGIASAESLDSTFYCPDHISSLFANLYLDVWDGGENGTPVNDDNYFALYVYNTVMNYKDFVKYWEVINSPDWDRSGDFGWLPPGRQGNWWENNPTPCDNSLQAPVFYYIRMLRITYEVIKTVSPSSYVVVGGISYPSFLDVVLRNTDNPSDGSIAPGYELYGGAYFDAVGIKSFPHFDGSTKHYDINLGEFVYERHSDAAVDGMKNLKQKFQTVLENYGYNGNVFPKKEWIVSAANLPRASFDDCIGSGIAQINWMIKAYVEAIKSGIRQMDILEIAEREKLEDANSPFDVMGLFENLDDVEPYNQEKTNEGIALKTTSDLLYATVLNETLIGEMSLPDDVRGAAFTDATGNNIYVLWAKTQFDESEFAEAMYSFPQNVFSGQLYKLEWDYSQDQEYEIISSLNVSLSGKPVFLLESLNIITPPLANFSVDDQIGCPGDIFSFTNTSTENANSFLWHFTGGTPNLTTAENPTVTYYEPGEYEVSLTVNNAAGSHTTTFWEYITIEDDPEAEFSYEIDGTTISCTNFSLNATSYEWDFGDGSATGYGYNPEHIYNENGDFTIRLIAMNDCGADTIYENVSIYVAPIADFIMVFQTCEPPYNVYFIDASDSNPETWQWTFEGGNPQNSSDENPFITFNEAGQYAVIQIVANSYGSDTLSSTVNINGIAENYLSKDLCEGDDIIVNGTVYNQNNPTGEEIIHDGSSSGCDSIIYVNLTYHEGQEVWVTDTIGSGETYMVGNSVYDETGNYLDTINTVFGCDSIVHLDLTVIVGIEEVAVSPFVLKCFPNPVTDKFVIEFELPRSFEVSLSLKDVLGRNTLYLMEKRYLPAGKYEVTEDLYDLSPGVYFLKMEAGGVYDILRIMKK